VDRQKLQVRKQWNKNPCGIRGIDPEISYGSSAFFGAVRKRRYEVDDPWIKEKIDFKSARGKKVLEIGYGMGTDLLTFRENGAKVYGVDITPEHYRLAKRNFALHHQKADLRLCDAAHLPFSAGSFDVVYSNGVLHHTPDTERCISEAYRVLKSGGKFILALYHTYSAFHLFSKVIFEGVLEGKLKKLGYRGLMSTLEHGADGIKIKPLVKTYSKSGLKRMLGKFSKVHFKVAHFKRDHLSKLAFVVPGFLEKVFEPWLGWYVIAYAIK